MEKSNCAYNFRMNGLNGFWTVPASKHYEYCSCNGHVKVKMLSGKEKWQKFHDGQYQFKVPFMLYKDFGSFLKPVDEQYREKMNKMKTERKGKTSYRKKINTHTTCVHSRRFWSIKNVPWQ